MIPNIDPTSLPVGEMAHGMGEFAQMLNDDEPSIEELQQRNEKGVGADLLSPGVTIGKFKVRAFTLASIMMLKQTASPLIAGIPVQDIENILLEIMKLIVLQSGSISEAAKLAHNPDALLAKAYELAETVTPEDVDAMAKETLEALQRATETQVKARAKGRPGEEVSEEMKEAAGIKTEGGNS